MAEISFYHFRFWGQFQTASSRERKHFWIWVHGPYSISEKYLIRSNNKPLKFIARLLLRYKYVAYLVTSSGQRSSIKPLDILSTKINTKRTKIKETKRTRKKTSEKLRLEKPCSKYVKRSQRSEKRKR